MFASAEYVNHLLIVIQKLTANQDFLCYTKSTMNEEDIAAVERGDGTDGPYRAQISKLIGNPAEQSATESLAEVERKMSVFERSTLRWTKATFFILAGTCLFIGFQWKEMRSGSADTHDLAVAAGKQAEAASKQAARMKDFADRMRDQADQSKLVAEAAKAQATAAINEVAELKAGVVETHELGNQARRSADIANKSVEVEERPWVGVTAIDLTDDVAFGKTPASIMTVQNTGRSPAIHVEIEHRMNAYCGQFPAKPVYEPAKPPSRTILLPGFPLKTDETKFTEPISGESMAILKRDDCSFYVFGKITYADTFGKVHWRHVCAYLKKGTARTLIQCNFYNDGDEDYPDGKEPN